MTETNPSPALSIPGDFRFGQALVTPDLVPSLGPLAAFAGTFTGSGFNTIFRPNLGSPTGGFPAAPVGPNDNVLELNLTSETLSFSSSLGSVPNRGEVQPDIFLNGVPYVQAITDVTIPAAPVGIHFEPGLWMAVPPTTTPGEGPTLVRMASIPHGTTICAQGTSQTFAGPPTIPPVSITPAGVPPFPSQTALNMNTERIPQDLTSFIAAGTINQGILDDPNTVLRHAIAGQNITSTTAISISTDPAGPLFGGGTDNIAFLLGEATAAQPNAQSASMTATFWIETVEHFILVPPVNPGRPLTFPAEIADDGRPVPTFLIDPPIPVTEARRIIVTSTQIQYSQTVILNFNGLAWPHVSVATLVPSAPVTIPPIVWAALLKEETQRRRPAAAS